MNAPQEPPRPMKFWEVLSAFRSREDILRDVFSREEWRDVYLELYTNSAQLIRDQERSILDAPVPVELSREIASKFDERFVFDPRTRILQSSHPLTASPDGLKMSALEVHDRFGGWVIEEVLESGSLHIP